LVGGVLLGHWLDGRMDTSPWLLLAGLVMGITLSSLAVVRQLNQAMAKINTVSKSNQGQEDPLPPPPPSGHLPASPLPEGGLRGVGGKGEENTHEH
jgi:hypothetical protein